MTSERLTIAPRGAHTEGAPSAVLAHFGILTGNKQTCEAPALPPMGWLPGKRPCG
jgi:hypothetical protein